MLKIPYGKSDYKTLIDNDYFYQDRTSYIQTLENWGPTYLLYLRPRRFGKTLWLSTLRHYYGLEHKQDFNHLFGNTFIGKNPTPQANAYMVLKFDFSAIDTASEQGVSDGFFTNVLNGVDVFLSDYDTFFSDKQKQGILAETKPNDIIKNLLNCYAINKINRKIYILIDEYDHFANELISFNFNHFLNIITTNGYVRKFYEAIKTGTSDGIIERIFMTGVSPITVDSLTSGFNIASNISLSPTFHQMVGFEEQEVAGILAKIDVPAEKIEPTLNDMRLWYNGYLFNSDLTKKVYNPNMVLFFAQGYTETQQYPRPMLDPNVASDYTKIQRLFSIQGKSEQYSNVLKTLLETGEVTAPLTDQYNFERGFTESDLVSLLFYMGFLTIKRGNLNRYTFTFPNYAIKRLYADYFFSTIAEKAQLPFNNKPINDAIEDMATSGNPKTFFEEVEKVLKHFSTRDATHFNENTLKAIIVSLLHQQNFYYIHSEYETEWTYMDVFLEAIHGQKPNYEIAVELKYVKKAGKTALSTLFQAATAQLRTYLDTPKFNTRTNIKSFVVVMAGDKLTYQELK